MIVPHRRFRIAPFNQPLKEEPGEATQTVIWGGDRSVEIPLLLKARASTTPWISY